MKKTELPVWAQRLLQRFPPYVWVCVCCAFAFQMLVFYGTHPLLAGRPVHDLTTIDDWIPFVPAWITVYYLAFPSWLVSAVWIISESREHGYRFTSCYMIALLIAGIAFLAWPGTMARPEITGSSFFERWVAFTYSVDKPVNYCPSLHVVFSYCCWRGTLGCRKIPKWYSRWNLLLLILVCCSTVFVKQHAFIDVPAGLLTAEAAFQIGRVTRPERLWFATERKLRKR